MKAIMTGVAIAALVAAAPALAGSGMQLAQAEPQAESQEMLNTAECPAGATETTEGEPCPPDTAVIDPAEESEETDAAAGAMEEGSDVTTGSMTDEEEFGESEAALGDELEADTTELVAGEGQKFIPEQDEAAILASELIGQTVYNPADEALGDVNDVVWYEEGDLEGVILGVGGFLGIGEKPVAVSYHALQIMTDEDGNRKIVLDATSEELDAAPRFVTSSEKMALIQAEQQQQALPPAPGGLAPAPEPVE